MRVGIGVCGTGTEPIRDTIKRILDTETATTDFIKPTPPDSDFNGDVLFTIVPNYNFDRISKCDHKELKKYLADRKGNR